QRKNKQAGTVRALRAAASNTPKRYPRRLALRRTRIGSGLVADGRLADSGRGASSCPLDMQGETDGALLYYMSCREPGAGPGDRGLSGQATKEFYRRHLSALRARCREICRRMGEPDSFAEDLANVTMAKAVRSHRTFVDGEDVASRATRPQAWLSQVALNLLRDKARNPLRSGPL